MNAPDKPLAVITGAGRGIGQAVAVELARAGYRLCLAARSRDQLETTRTLCGLEPAQSLIVLLDLAETEAPDALIETALGLYGRLDVLVNNAGWAPPRRSLTKVSEADQDRMLAVNLRAPIALTRLAAAQMLKQGGGTIINIASTAGLRSPAMEAIYAAAKAGLIAFSMACFNEFREGAVRVTVMIPGLVDTGFIPPNKHLDRALMLQPADIARAVGQILVAAPGTCPVEVVLEPARNPERPR
ncbi:MAG TPA: SDR family oxidoreductase [Candidatus Binataceae bacterium]|jgi:short-subunit dehydrogenase